VTLIATCPVCVGETHPLRGGGRPSMWCGRSMRILDERDCWTVNQPLTVARIDGGDPGDEDQEVRR